MLSERLRDEDPEEPSRPPRPPRPPRPDAKKLRDVLQAPFGVRNVALSGLFILAAFYTLYFCRSFFLPIVLAVLLSLLLTPAVRLLTKLRVPQVLAAGLVFLSLLGGVGLGIYELSTPAYEWMQKAPQSLRKVESKLRDLKRPVQTIGKATAQVERMAEVGAAGSSPRAVAVTAPSLGARLVSQTTEFLANTAVMLILLFFLLASGDLFLRKLIRVLPSLADKRRAVEIARQVETEISTYLTTVTLINIGLGLATWLAMAWIGLPNPLLWGVVAAVTNYIPYLGAIVTYAVLAMVGFLTFDTLGQSLLPVGAFAVLNVLEAYLITPMVLGRRLTLNPVVLFLGLTFWGWLWGIVGAVLAVPIMVVFKIFCDHIEPLAPIGEFLGE
jgi:predicted PurR-regulated permease PerM